MMDIATSTATENPAVTVLLAALEDKNNQLARLRTCLEEHLAVVDRIRHDISRLADQAVDLHRAIVLIRGGEG